MGMAGVDGGARWHVAPQQAFGTALDLWALRLSAQPCRGGGDNNIDHTDNRSTAVVANLSLIASTLRSGAANMNAPELLAFGVSLRARLGNRVIPRLSLLAAVATNDDTVAGVCGAAGGHVRVYVDTSYQIHRHLDVLYMAIARPPPSPTPPNEMPKLGSRGQLTPPAVVDGAPA